MQEEEKLRLCCWLKCDDEGEPVRNKDGKLIGCESKAVFCITPEGDPYSYTDSCWEHVGEMLTDARYHELVRIG